jgi:hypothetical protein
VSSNAATSKRSFSVNGSVRIEAEDRAGRERLLRYCARPPFALDWLRELDSERLVYDHPKRGPGGSGPLLLTPLELLDCLAALVPPPRVHRHRYFGVLARTAAYRKFPLRPRPCPVVHRSPERTYMVLAPFDAPRHRSRATDFGADAPGGQIP